MACRARGNGRWQRRRWREATGPSCASRWKKMASSRLRHGRTRAEYGLARTEPAAGAASNDGRMGGGRSKKSEPGVVSAE